MATKQTVKETVEKTKRVSKGWLESLKTQGTITINDPQLA